MIKTKNLCLLGILAALMLSACSGKASKEYVTHGENISNESGDTSLIMDSDEGKKAELTMPPEASRVTLKVGVVKNDAAASAMAALAAENAEDKAFEKYEFVCADSYTQLSEMLKNNEVGAAVMPPLKAMDMYASGKSVKVIASIADKSYKLVGEGISSLSDLSGKTVYISGDDKTSVCLMTKLLTYAGINDCTLQSVADNNELYKAVKDGSATYALVTEPYLSMLKQDGVATTVYDFSTDWENATEGNAYCSGCVVANNEFITKNKAVIDYMLADIERSVSSVKSDAATCAQQSVEFGFADDAKSIETAYTGMDLNFYTDTRMRYLINNMFTAFDNANPDVLGTEIPDEGFYLVKSE